MMIGFAKTLYHPASLHRRTSRLNALSESRRTTQLTPELIADKQYPR
jgi:hypothetical protein